MQWISIGLKRNSLLSDISSKYPGALIASWSNGNYEIVEFFCREPIAFSHIKSDLLKLAKKRTITLRNSFSSYHDLLVTQIRNKKSDSTNIQKIIKQQNGLVSFPVTFQKGSEFYRIIALRDDDVPEMLESIGKFGNLRIIQRLQIEEIPVEQSFTFSTSDLFSKITEKQATALLSAVSLGYYKVPRRTKFEDLARYSGVPRTTFETHVRKAESKIIGAISPYLSVRFGAQQPEPLMFSRAHGGHLTAKQFYNRTRSSTKEHALMVNEFFKAIKKGEYTIVEEMASSNPALVQEKDESGLSAVIVATYYGQPEIAKLLTSKGANLSVYEAAMVGETQVLKRLVQKDQSLATSYSTDGFTPLHLAAFFGSLDAARILIESGANVNAVAKNLMKVTPLHSSAARNQIEIASLLISNGADVNAKQENSYTALHAAAQNGNSQLAELLLKHGANLYAKTDEGETPLDMTRIEGPESGSKESREKVAKILENRAK